MAVSKGTSLLLLTRVYIRLSLLQIRSLTLVFYCSKDSSQSFINRINLEWYYLLSLVTSTVTYFCHKDQYEMYSWDLFLKKSLDVVFKKKKKKALTKHCIPRFHGTYFKLMKFWNRLPQWLINIRLGYVKWGTWYQNQQNMYDSFMLSFDLDGIYNNTHLTMLKLPKSFLTLLIFQHDHVCLFFFFFTAVQMNFLHLKKGHKQYCVL